MAEQTPTGKTPTGQFPPSSRRTGSGAPEPEPRVHLITIGGVVFAVCILAIIGLFHMIAGLATVLDHNFARQQDDYTYDLDVAWRGWIQMVSGAVVLVAAFLIFSGRTWARVVGIAVAGLSALENFIFTPYHLAWSAILIFLDVLVIWSLAVYGHREAHKVYGAPL
ncbi:DUF7144 family membrane protein [Streptomyces flavofungini]|uniref:DUF7144 domain-containing protein n=1 Tax=Streptomyces flavofungini TaxID=68200 RepID=A0ABS0X953_9ACTN|nr:hypothetical protein [Streptomyces flavofungini]MBJ3809679.1 hypothetical protein [Streptomyces flavofungini]GHC80041.1 membrane protein [Streptomyces flavofungini]